MDKFFRISRVVSLILGYLITFLFIFEFIGEFSSGVEGLFYTNGIKWRYPLILGILSFGFAYLVGGKNKTIKIGSVLLLGTVGAFVLIYIIALISMTTV